MRNAWTVAIVIVFVCIGCRNSAEAVPAAIQPTEDAARQQRGVDLEGQSNFRDLGGYRTVDGRMLKWGQVYRSGALSRLTDADVSRLGDLHVKTVISFLTDEEIAASGPDRLPNDVKEIALPIRVGDDLASVASTAIRSGDFSKLPPEINAQVHAILAAESRAEYAAVLREVGRPGSRPIVFHCSHGVHRAGTAAAILLWALGVPWETVRADYLLSNTYRREVVRKRLEQMRAHGAKKQGIEPQRVDMTNIEAFYVLQGSYIDAARDRILAEYGSIDAYLSQGLGLSDTEIGRLREQLLE